MNYRANLKGKAPITRLFQIFRDYYTNIKGPLSQQTWIVDSSRNQILEGYMSAITLHYSFETSVYRLSYYNSLWEINWGVIDTPF